MKKLISLILVLILFTGCLGFAYAEPIDISSFTVEELIELESLVEKALMGEILTKDTELPVGKYVVGKDLVPGNYVITAVSGYSSPEVYLKVIDGDNKLVESFTLSPSTCCKITLEDGMTLEVSNDNGYLITANIRTFAGFLIEKNGYILKDTLSTTSDATSGSTNNSVYTYLFDKWNLYKAYSLPGGLVLIEDWYRFNASDGNPFKKDHTVLTIDPADGTTDFRWLDDEHTAFAITMSDKQNSDFKNPTFVVFTLGE